MAYFGSEILVRGKIQDEFEAFTRWVDQAE